MSRNQTVYLVVNSAAGDKTSPNYVRRYVEPLLRSIGYDTVTVQTQSVGDAARIAREIGLTDPGPSSSGDGDSTRTVLLAGGDGTAHEFIEGIYSLKGSEAGNIRWTLIIIPLGTANALYASTYPPGTPSPTFPAAQSALIDSLNEDIVSKLHSLAAFLDPITTPTPLPIAELSIVGPETSSAFPPIPIPSHVVISTCLHSNLLATAESLRAEHPGVERFKVAAQQNAGKFYSANVKLYPTSRGPVEVYDPASSAFVTSDIGGVAGSSSTTVEMEDDFAYFLSSSSCPRLEPTFVISPLIRRLPQPESMDVCILRPSCDPRIRSILSKRGYTSIRAAKEAGDESALEALSAAWVPRAWEVLGKAYEEGAHADLTYSPEGNTERAGPGERVVEVYRCAGFEWRPLDRKDSAAHLVCADGSLVNIPEGGSASVRLAERGEGGNEGGGIFLWS